MKQSSQKQGFLLADTAKRVQVLLPYPFDRSYDYAMPENMILKEGDYVRVPFGRKESIGVIWSLESKDDIDPKKIKLIEKKYDFPPMLKVQHKFIEWVAKYTMADLGSVLKMSLSSEAALEPPKKARLKIAPCQIDEIPQNTLILSEEQKKSAKALQEIVSAKKHRAVLLDGVTGSGKTEVYFEAIAQALNQGKQVLVLLPEIFLSAQFLERFERRFGVRPAVWHSDITPAQKRLVWSGVAKGETRVVVGARSALFLPYAELGLIIVDEEHETSYKQEEGVLYNARDMAIVRSHLENFPIVLVSATPSLETMCNVKEEKYDYLYLPSRYAGATLPEIHIIDLKKDKPSRGKFISPILEKALLDNFEAKEQSLLFLNRRGYAPLTLCRTCGYRFQCPSCSAWLVEHKRYKVLQCHHCGFKRKISKICPECENEESLVACGPGVERIAEELDILIPDARVVILASDIVTSPKMIGELIKQIENHEIDIIIGTQIIAKGHHFPELTCVGIIDADLGLSGGDLRAGERTFQLLNQVSGRAGRGEKSGNVYLQTYMPDQMVIHALAENNRDKFLDVELRERARATMPPHGKLASLIISSKNDEALDSFCQSLAQKAPRFNDIKILGPAPAPMEFLRGQHRRRFLIKAEKNIHIQGFIKEWLALESPPSNIKLKVDIDPQSFY